MALPLTGSVSTADEPTTRPISELVKPSLITLAVKDATVQSVLDAMQKQSRIRIVVGGEAPDETKLSVDFKNTPWLEALGKVCKATRREPALLTGDYWAMTSAAADRSPSVHDVQGPAMVVLSGIVVNRNLAYGQTHRSSRKITLTAKLLVEPSVEIAGVYSVADGLLTDRLGRQFSVKLNTPPTSHVRTKLSRDFVLIGEIPDKNAERIASVSGTVIAPVVVERKTLLIPDLLTSAGTSVPFARGEVTVEAIRRRVGEAYEVDLRFARQALPEIALAHLRAVPAVAWPVQSNKTHPARIRVQRSFNQDGDRWLTLSVDFEHVPDRVDEQATPKLDLSWNLPVRYLDASIPFTFKDIQLP